MTTEILPNPNLNYPVLTKYDTTNANRVIITDINSQLITSMVTSTELSYLSGVTSNIQSQINTLIAGGFKYNSTAILDPTATDDSSLGYTRCSLWVNSVDNTAFICVDESIGSAVWDVITWDQPLNTTDDVVFNKVTASDGLDVVTGDTSVVNFKPGSQGLDGNSLKSDGIGGVYWGSDTGIVYNGTLPSVLGGHIKLNITDGSTVDESKLVEDATNLNMGGLNVTNCDYITSNKFIVEGGTNIQYMLADGSLLTASSNSGNSNYYLFHSISTSQAPPIPNGDVKYNNINQSLSTIVYISHITRDLIDVDVFFNNISSLNFLYIQDQENSINFIKYDITASPSILPNNYISIPVLAVSSGGTGSTSFGSGHNILVAIFTNSIETDTRITTLETKTQNQTAIVNTTTFAGSLVCSGLNMNSTKITNLATPTLTTDATNKGYVDTNIGTVQNTANNALPKSGGTMTGSINSLNILPTATNTNSVGSSTFPYLNSEATTINTKTLTIWNSARTFNHSVTSLASTANVPMTLPSAQSFGVLQNNGFGTLYWSNVLSPMNVITSGAITGGSFITNGLISPAVDSTTDLGTAGKRFNNAYINNLYNSSYYNVMKQRTLYIQSVPLTIYNLTSTYDNTYQNAMPSANGVINGNNILANTLEVGSSFSFTVGGTSTCTVLTDKTGMGLYVNSTVVAGTGAMAVAGITGTVSMRGEIVFTINTIGSLGTLTTYGNIQLRGSNNVVSMATFNTKLVSINTTIDNIFKLALLTESVGGVGVGSNMAIFCLSMKQLY